MLHLLDESLETFLRATMPVTASDVDVSFAAPDRDWGARVSRPTINLYLWDVRPNFDQRDAGVEVVANPNGRAYRRAPLPRVDCRYLVTAWTSDVRDEHALLGRALVALLREDELPERHLRGVLAAVRPLPAVSLGAQGQQSSEFWSALGGQLKPGLDLVVTVTVDAELAAEVGPDVAQYTIRTAVDGGAPEERHLVRGHSDEPVDTVVTTPRGAGRVRPDGGFVVPGRPGDPVTVGDEPAGRVPEHGPIG